jgi:hypothetical protein
MTGSFKKSVLIIFLLVFHTAAVPLTIKFFGSTTCGECMEIRESLLKPIAEKYKNKLNLITYDTESDSGLAMLVKTEKEFGVSSDAAQMLFFPDTFLSGYNDIMKLADTMIESRINGTAVIEKKHDTSSTNTDLTTILKNKSTNWGFFAGTVATGLADGINPCAIATMIFLISFLATRKKKKTEILTIGLTYTAAVFLTYFSMGMGLKSILENIKGYYLVSQIIRWGAFTLAAAVAVFSFKDALAFRKSADTKDISLQLPTAVKMRIHKIISGNLSGTSLVIGSIITGFLVTILEAICTGQMYLPYIVAMTQKETLRLNGYLYLALYNFLFVLPLLIVMILAYFGMKWSDLAKKTQKSMVWLKVALGVVMTCLAIYIGSGLIPHR